ncbi:hypothetical protein ONZ51_g11060 [Trametes cubensis]|uniref:Uncharacterized protein n=1 Tax=Trametes cubensis TaxID=1111947 RepID=A0AAD7X4C6_9APHY|nr:hypothetical protein ONZ51_g11060 [Trametes cubensis]
MSVPPSIIPGRTSISLFSSVISISSLPTDTSLRSDTGSTTSLPNSTSAIPSNSTKFSTPPSRARSYVITILIPILSFILIAITVTLLYKQIQRGESSFKIPGRDRPYGPQAISNPSSDDPDRTPPGSESTQCGREQDANLNDASGSEPPVDIEQRINAVSPPGPCFKQTTLGSSLATASLGDLQGLIVRHASLTSSVRAIDERSAMSSLVDQSHAVQMAHAISRLREKRLLALFRPTTHPSNTLHPRIPQHLLAATSKPMDTERGPLDVELRTQPCIGTTSGLPIDLPPPYDLLRRGGPGPI